MSCIKPFVCGLFICLVTSYSAFAFEYEISCDENILIDFKEVASEPESDECRSFIANGFLKCFDSFKLSPTAEALVISTPIDQYYKSKESSQYSRSKIFEIIQNAVRAGQDPYLILGLVTLESPPLLGEGYSSSWGKIPMDLIAVADSFGCDSIAAKDNKVFRSFHNRGKLKSFNLEPTEEEHILCLNKDSFAGSRPLFTKLSAPDPQRCCAAVRISGKNILPIPLPDGSTQKMLGGSGWDTLVDTVAGDYLKARFSWAQKSKVDPTSAPEEKVAVLAQSFNGYGKFGSTERNGKNKCLDGIDMGKTPVYGAGAAELMLNSFLNNSEIRRMVDKATNKQKGKGPHSYLCSSYGNGKHKISGLAFSNLLNQYLGARPSCPRHTNLIKGSLSPVKGVQ